MLVDMDAFFASVEQVSNPALRGRPIAVIGAEKRTVVTTCSYEARRFGVKTGMSIHEARRHCPGLATVIGNNRKYAYTCKKLADIYHKYTPTVEIYSIDESFLDITQTNHLFGGPIGTGEKIKADIRAAFGLNATIGIAHNKLMAKLISDISKPDGLRHVMPEETLALLEALPVGKLWGIGKGIERKLNAMGIFTCGQLGRAPVPRLKGLFGIMGERLNAMGRGIDTQEVTPGLKHGVEQAKSIGHSTTLPRDISSMPEIESCVLRLSEMAARRARKHRLMGSVVTATIRYKSFNTVSRQKKMNAHTNDTHVVYAQAMEIIRGERLREPVRLLGVSISDLIEDAGQMSLFGEINRRRALVEAVDRVNDRYGEDTLMWALYARHKRPLVAISPAWRPDGVRRTAV
ncbi:MAG: DNA polymerase IV [Nitrospirae bacterium]|nr:DNA polymerase IV [Nitrospirota bacterium]